MSLDGLVSTIIPVRNRAELVQEAVRSVLEQTHRPIEIIIVDDGSTDNTTTVLKELANSRPDEVRVQRQENHGPGAARETGRLLARGEFIQYLDSDDLLLPEKFEWQVGGLRNDPDAAASYGITRCYSFGELPGYEPCKRTGERIGTMFPGFLESRWWSTSTPLYRRSVCDAAGPWTTLWNEEDWEYDCRIAAAGGRLHYVPEYVSDTRRGNDGQLSDGGHVNPVKLKDRAEAHRLILGHAKRYGIDHESAEMRHFARELFLLSRQCGAVGLTEQSIMLFDLAREASTPDRQNGWDFVLYGNTARMIGWKGAGRVARFLDTALRAIVR